MKYYGQYQPLGSRDNADGLAHFEYEQYWLSDERTQTPFGQEGTH